MVSHQCYFFYISYINKPEKTVIFCNPDFNRMEFQTIRNEPGRLLITQEQWLERMNAILTTCKKSLQVHAYLHIFMFIHNQKKCHIARKIMLCGTFSMLLQELKKII